MTQDIKLLFEKSRPGRRAVQLPENELINTYAPDSALQRETPPRLPELGEVDVVRHYTALSKRAYGVDDGFYPLGSCTMKYNPKVNETVAAWRTFTDIHPLQPAQTAQGCLEVLFSMQQMLSVIAGMDATTMQPAAGAHGEWTGLLLIRAYHLDRGDNKRTKVIVPDSAHGTNPASAALCGFDVITVPSDADGFMDTAALEAVMDESVAALMLTNPNTLGKFEKSIIQISKIVHDKGGLLYYDGANMNAIIGTARPGDMGFDVVHWNLHKTLSTPHGGGGPGSGPVGCKSFLERYLPVPVIEEENGVYGLTEDRPQSIGRVKSFYGNFLVAVKAMCYLCALGAQGIRRVSEHAVLNANYMLQALQKYSSLIYGSPCMHEFVMDLSVLKQRTGVSALDIAKALIDKGIHPPTMYFPLIVHEALMIEPTETESIETLDAAIKMIEDVITQAETEPEKLHEAPVTTPVGRPDEVAAARRPILRYAFDGEEGL